MTVLILLCVVLAVVAALVPLARKQLLRERRRVEARQRVAAHMAAMQRGFEQMAVTIGTALLPAMTSAAEAMNRMSAAFAALGQIDSKGKQK